MARYRTIKGRSVRLDHPFRTPNQRKKFAVYVVNPKTDNVIKVRFGDSKMEIRRDNPKRLKSFRARHKCETRNDITKPSYWSCKMWEKKKSVTDYLN
jgi:IS1 family transposase